MKNPIIRIAAKFQYKIPSLRALAVMDTISWSRCRPHRNSCTFLQRSWSREDAVDVSTFPPPPLEKLALKTVQWNAVIKIIIIIVIVVVVSCCRRWWYLSSNHIFQVYYKVRKVLLQSATEQRQVKTLYCVSSLFSLKPVVVPGKITTTMEFSCQNVARSRARTNLKVSNANLTTFWKRIKLVPSIMQ